MSKLQELKEVHKVAPTTVGEYFKESLEIEWDWFSPKAKIGKRKTVIDRMGVEVDSKTIIYAVEADPLKTYFYDEKGNRIYLMVGSVKA